MAERSSDLFVSTEEVEVDEQTLAAIERGIRDADEGRLVSSEEVAAKVQEWISKYSTQRRP